MIARYGNVLCLADATQYKLLHVDSGNINPLFPYLSHSSPNLGGSGAAGSGSPALGSSRSGRPLSIASSLPATSLFRPSLQHSHSTPLPSIIRPQIAVVGDGEFLVTTGAPNQTSLGMFIGATGDPVRGTIQWSSYPRSVGMCRASLGHHCLGLTYACRCPIPTRGILDQGRVGGHPRSAQPPHAGSCPGAGASL